MHRASARCHRRAKGVKGNEPGGHGIARAIPPCTAFIPSFGVPSGERSEADSPSSATRREHGRPKGSRERAWGGAWRQATTEGSSLSATRGNCGTGLCSRNVNDKQSAARTTMGRGGVGVADESRAKEHGIREDDRCGHHRWPGARAETVSPTAPRRTILPQRKTVVLGFRRGG